MSVPALSSTHPRRHIETAAYRQLMSAFPTGVTVVTSLSQESVPAGLTCSSLTSVTMSPPTLLVCLSKGSWTASAVVERGSFAVNLLHARAQGAAELFAGPTFNRFSQVDWRPSPLLGLPWLVADALAVAECQVSDARVVGDHTVVFGEVVGVSQEPDVPLLYGLRSFSTWREAI